MRSKKRPCNSWTSVPTMMKRSARLRASVSVDMIQPLVCSTFKLRNCASLRAWSTMPPAFSASDMTARMPSTSVARPPKSGKLGLDAAGGGRDGLVERDLLALDLRAWPWGGCARSRRPTVRSRSSGLSGGPGARDLEIVAKESAKRASDILVEFGSGSSPDPTPVQLMSMQSPSRGPQQSTDAAQNNTGANAALCRGAGNCEGFVPATMVGARGAPETLETRRKPDVEALVLGSAVLALLPVAASAHGRAARR